MRKLFVTLFIASLSFASCKKEHQSTNDKTIVGQWKWISQYRGAPSNTLTPQNTGTEEILIFNNDNSWLVMQNGNTANSGTFKTSFETSRLGEKVNRIDYLNLTSPTDSTRYYKIYNDTLLFSNDLIGSIGDGVRYYVKQQ